MNKSNAAHNYAAKSSARMDNIRVFKSFIVGEIATFSMDVVNRH